MKIIGNRKIDEKKQAFLDRNQKNFTLSKKWFHHMPEICDALEHTELMIDNTQPFLSRVKIEMKEFGIALKAMASILILFKNWHELSFYSSTKHNKIEYLKNGNNQYLSNAALKNGIIFLDGIELLSNTPTYLNDDYVFFHEFAHLLQVKGKSLFLNIDSKPTQIFNQTFHSVENNWHTRLVESYRTLMLESFCDLLSLYLTQKKNQLPQEEFHHLVKQVMEMRTKHNHLTHNTTQALQMALDRDYFNQPFESILEATYRVSLAFTYEKFKHAIDEGVVFTNSVKKILINFDDVKNHFQENLPTTQYSSCSIDKNQTQSLGVDVVFFSNQLFFDDKESKIYPFNNYNRLAAQKKLESFRSLLDSEQTKLLDLSVSLNSELKAEHKKNKHLNA